MLIHPYELFKMFGEFITKMFIKMAKITNSLLVWMFLVMPKLQRIDHEVDFVICVEIRSL